MQLKSSNGWDNKRVMLHGTPLIDELTVQKRVGLAPDTRPLEYLTLTVAHLFHDSTFLMLTFRNFNFSAPGGDLQTLLDENLVPYERDVINFLRQLLEGLVFIHDRSLVHLDIKPQNLVLMGEFPDCAVKLCDFEISRHITPGYEVREILGTPDYVAPEILHYEPITTRTDMWSLGVLTYVLLTGFLPFGGDSDQETFMQISRGELDFPNELFEDITPEAIDFMKKLLVRQPERRMSARECLKHPWMQRPMTRPTPPSTLDLPAPVTPSPPSHTPYVSRAESSPSVITTTVTSDIKGDGNETSDLESLDDKTPTTPLSSRPPLHPRSSLKSLSVTSDILPVGSTSHAVTPLSGITPFLNKESRMGSRQNLNRLRTMSKSREVLSERIQMSNLKKTLSKSRERLYDAKLGMSTSREDLMTCKSLSQSVEALTALSQLHQNGALYKSCNNIFIPKIQHVNKEACMSDRMYKSMACIDQIPGNDLSKTMGYFESRLTGDDDNTDVITRRNTSLNIVISDTPESNSRLLGNDETRLGGFRVNPCRGGRSAEGNDRIFPRHSHKQSEPQATQKINKMSRADKMKKDAQRRRKEREQREKERSRKSSLVEMRTYDKTAANEGSTSPTIRRGSVCHVELRLQERHERLLERQEREGRKMSSTGSLRLSSIDSDKSPTPDASKSMSRRKSTSQTAKNERSSKVESPKSSDISEASSTESVSGSLENIQPRGVERRRKSKQLDNRRASATVKNQKSNDENGNVIQVESSSLAAEISMQKSCRDLDEAYISLEEGSRENVPGEEEEAKSDEDTDSVESDKTCTGSIVEGPITPIKAADEIRITTEGPTDKQPSPAIEDTEHTITHETQKSCGSFLEVPVLGDIQEESTSVKYSRSTSTTSDLGGSICEDNEENSDQALSEIEQKIMENKSRARSLSMQPRQTLTVIPRVRNRSNSVHQPTIVDRARPWGEICSGSVAKALKNLTMREEEEEDEDATRVSQDFTKRRQSSPPRFFMAGELQPQTAVSPQCKQ
ncbi:hypothetical protein HAZT_HAZT007829 [Hyalella azteca]|uniref:Protein kinase domain-containing protein n=1 Tax=Hyalella azteca TaxID=294128 RepID=A0A6A0HAE4_HYAAZ|nr:hypothetical protein HAZT_HAZT007829 [Hyalella azteca]